MSFFSRIAGLFRRGDPTDVHVQRYEEAAKGLTEASDRVVERLEREPLDLLYEDVRNRKRPNGGGSRGKDEQRRSNRRPTVRSR